MRCALYWFKDCVMRATVRSSLEPRVFTAISDEKSGLGAI